MINDEDREQDVELEEGLFFDYNKELSDYILKFSENELMLPVLANAMASQIGNGIIVRKFPFWKNKIPATFDLAKNVVYLNKAFIPATQALFQSIDPFHKDSKKYKTIFKGPMGVLIGGLCYFGIHLYNIKNRGILIKEQDNQTWYKNMFFKTIFDYTNLSTLSRKAADMWAVPFMNIVLNYFEVRSYSNVDFTKKQKGQLDYMFNQFHLKVISELRDWNFDDQSIASYNEWFIQYMKEFDIIFKNRGTVVLEFDDEFMNFQEFEALNLPAMTFAYKVLSSRSSIETDRFPAAPFKELYNTAEPFAQVINSLVKQNKLQDSEKFQILASRGLAYLGN